ncbi:MAG: hypothetical protein JWL84_406 [Rhodospirillales bacterium]|nr:hypothetical protein [Rhodospirillales bacterium]
MYVTICRLYETNPEAMQMFEALAREEGEDDMAARRQVEAGQRYRSAKVDYASAARTSSATGSRPTARFGSRTTRQE